MSGWNAVGIQTPVIGNALRIALGLNAAGSMPMDMETTVIPVVMVGDVRAQLNSGQVGFSSFKSAAAVAAQFGQVMLEVPVAHPTVAYVVPKRIVITCGGVSRVYWRLGTNTFPVVQDAVPRRLSAQLADSTAAARVVGGSNGTAPTIANMQGERIFLAAGTYEWIPPIDMLIESAPTGAALSLGFHCDAANTLLEVEIEWLEIARL
jgi:hypothetical protein